MVLITRYIIYDTHTARSTHFCVDSDNTQTFTDYTCVWGNEINAKMVSCLLYAFLYADVKTGQALWQLARQFE